MAGIGFELKKIYGRKTLVDNMWGTLYATMTTIGPTVMTAVLMIVLQILLNQAQITQLEIRFFISSITYALLIAFLISNFLSTVISRYIADCIYLKDISNISSSLFGSITLSTIISGIVMLVLSFGIYFYNPSVSLTFLLPYYLLGIMVTDTYILMTYASAIKQYKQITFGFLGGAAIAILVYFVCRAAIPSLSKTESATISLLSCYFFIVLILVFQSVKAFGISKRGSFQFLAYFRKYPRLIISSCAYALGLYGPTIIYWMFSGMSEQINIFKTTPVYDLSLFLAFTVNMPALVIFVVKVETAFYDSYTAYVSALNTGSYSLIEKEREKMVRVLRHELFFVFEIQLIITVVSVCILSVFLPYLSISANVLHMFIILSLAMYTIFCMYFTFIVFYYFSDYDGAFIGSLIFLIVTIVCSFFMLNAAFYSLPLLIGGLCGWVVSFLLLRHRMNNLTSFLMC